jgi:PAS domain S-box-containing protein
MLVGERIIGVMSVQTYRAHHYDRDDLLLAATIADQAAVAVENARLYEAVRLELDVRQRTEQGLRESEEKFRNLAEESPNMIFINRARRVVYANHQCELTMGYAREEFYAPDFDYQSMTAPGYEALLETNFRRHMQGEEVAPYEYTLVTRTGRRIDAILTTKLIRYGDQPAILGIITDITARARTERLLQSLHAAALSMEQALSPAEIFPAASRVLAAVGCDSAVFLADPERRVLRAHCWTDASTGKVTTLPADGAPVAFEASPVVARALENRATLFTAEAAALGRLFRDTGIAREPAAGEQGGRIVSPLAVGEELVGLIVVSGPYVSGDDVPIYALFAHQAAAAWRKTRLMGDLQASLQQLRQTQEQLLSAQKMEAVGRLAGGIAHDFNNLLTVISGYASLLGDAVKGNEPALADLDHIRTTVKRASALTGRLLSFSRRQILQPTVMDMNRVVPASLSLLRPLIGEDIEVAVRLVPEPLSVRADRYQLEQVLMNLAVNARDAMPGGGRLVVETAVALVDAGGRAVYRGAQPGFATRLPAGLETGAWVVLRVEDNGVGMSDETRAHLFEPFFTTKEEGKGSGLGLSTVYGIVSQSGGKVDVESTIGRGTSFTVCLPLVPEGAEREEEARPARAAPQGAGTVLVVEDEVDVRELARRVLERAGYRVVTAASAREALLIAEGTAVLDCIVTDVVMPGGMSGVEMGERLSRSRPGVPVLYMSGYTDDVRFHSAGGSRLPFLAKPFQPDELLENIRDALRRA